ncbi:sulfotransferase family 2 domain-containing protein [Marivita sp. S0852]|uniref:sulfotransferase family 2 domain-containing protein n=1 Tax=Marivita sp. S0852 TaxID=3373893 RepID=UPI003981B845
MALKLIEKLGLKLAPPSTPSFVPAHPYDFSHVPSPLKRPPTCQAMMVDDLKIIYLPIAKNACSSLKRLVANLGGVELQDGEDIHHKLDANDTGLQFEDRTDNDIRRALSDPSWMRFVVMRDPLDRLVSVYVEKFVQNRTIAGQAPTTGPVLEAVLGKEDLTPEDFDTGITFREFAEYILSERPERLNGHWRPQAEYLGHIPFTHMYDVKNLEQLANDLRGHIGQDIDLPRMNVSREAAKKPIYDTHAPDKRPTDLSNAKHLSMESFLPPDLRSRLEEYFATDVTLHNVLSKSDCSSA